MERKTTQRIIGILVAVALLVILMPLVFSKSDLSTQQTTAIKAPPFPEQSQPQESHPEHLGETVSTQADITPDMAAKINGMPVEPAMHDNTDLSMTEQTTAEATQAEHSIGVDPTQDTQSPLASADQLVPAPQSSSAGFTPLNKPAPTAIIPDDTIPPQTLADADIVSKPDHPNELSASAQPTNSETVTHQSVAASIDNELKATPEPIKIAVTDPSESVLSIKNEEAPIADDITPKSSPALKKIASNADSAKEVGSNVLADNQANQPTQSTIEKKVIAHPKLSSAIHPKVASRLKQPGWVIQMGSFRDKDNARRLADRLRGAGYKAFIHEIKSARGSVQTRVYIGPEVKQLAAMKLSSKVEQETNLHGLVVMYKPFEL